MLRMDEINKIRKAYFTEGLSKYEIAKKYNRSWKTIDRIVSMERDELNVRGKRPKRVGKIMTPEMVEIIEGYLKEEEQKKVKKKQRYTSPVIFKKIKEQGYQGSLRRVQEVVLDLRKKLGQATKPSYLPLEFELGTTLQMDHGEADVIIGGKRTRGYLFVASVPGAALRYCQIYPTKAGEAWGAFHEQAFEFFGGIFEKITYDNDSVLVKKIKGRDRDQTNFSLELEEHYGIQSHFCNAGAGNEKGAVENGVGYCRRNYLPGLPEYNSWQQVNTELENNCKCAINEKDYKTKPLKELLTQVQAHLKPLREEKQWRRWAECHVDHCQLITIENSQYSVPEKYVGSRVRVALTPFQITIIKDEEIATHPRQYGTDSLNLDHYLNQLYRKPHALNHSKAIKGHQFHPLQQEIWRRLSKKYDTKQANRQFITILQLRRICTAEQHLESIEKALNCGAIESDAVEQILKQNQTAIEEKHWEYDLSEYKKLCGGAV